MTDIRDQVVMVLEAEIEERQKIISALLSMGSSNGHKRAAAKSAPTRRWSAERRKKFKATLKKKKAASVS